MRIILLCCFVLLIGNGYAQYSYIPLMPNEPAFTNAGQFKTSGTISFNHIEGQAAFSPLKHVALLAGSFRGTRKQWSSEYGVAGYHSFNIGSRKLHFSIGCTFGEGEVLGETKKDISSYSYTNYDRINGYYRSINLQTALYFKYDYSDAKHILGIVFKHSRINYNYLIKDYVTKIYNTVVYNKNKLYENNLMITGNYLALFGHIEPKKIPFYFNWQIGIKPISNVAELLEKDKTGNPRADRIAFNTSIGINLDFY